MLKNLNVLFCRRQQNNFQHSRYNYGTGLVVRGCRPAMRIVDKNPVVITKKTSTGK
jgi:hypothetical protein